MNNFLVPIFHALRRLGVGAAAVLLLCSSAFAQVQMGAEGEDPPGRVGRLSELTGAVWLYSPDSGEWESATRNLPLTSGDRLSTDEGARAEVRIGSVTLRLDGGSELEVLRIDDEKISLRLHQGSAGARFASRDTVNEFELLTGEGRFLVQRSGRYRFDRRDPTSQLTVYSGQALYEGPGSALTLYSGQRGDFWLDGGNVAQYSLSDPLRDSFSAWNAERDRAEERSASTQYVSPEMTGVEDLDRHGRWEQDSEHGPLWVPRGVSPGWAPYSTGRWAWVRPWGWTWVDDAAWGFAPFHYGRWLMVRNIWCWSPGQRVHRPVYAPALVGWVGGPRFNLSINVGGGPNIGWFPLAPREVYVPSYRVSPRYVRHVNDGHVHWSRDQDAEQWRRLHAPAADSGRPEFRNRRIPQALTVVPATVMTGKEPVTRWREQGGHRELGNGPGRSETLLAPPVEAPRPRSFSTERATPTPRPTRPAAEVRPDQRPDVTVDSRDRTVRDPRIVPLPARTEAPAPRPRSTVVPGRDPFPNARPQIAPVKEPVRPPRAVRVEPARTEALPAEPAEPKRQAQPQARPQVAPQPRPTDVPSERARDEDLRKLRPELQREPRNDPQRDPQREPRGRVQER